MSSPHPATTLLNHHMSNPTTTTIPQQSSSVAPTPSQMHNSGPSVHTQQQKEAYTAPMIDYPALARNATFSSRRFSLRRTFSRMSKRSYLSNMSTMNRKNLTRFGKSKITFLVFNTIFTFVALSVLLACVFTWSNNFLYAPFIKLLRLDLLIIATSVSTLMSVVGFLGFLGAFTHRKTLLTVYNVLCWPVLGGFIALAYLAYRDVNGTQWENILSLRWDELYASRQLVQMKFNCCGFYSELDRPWVDAQCTGLVDSSPDSSDAGSNSTDMSSNRRLFRRSTRALKARQQSVTSSGLSGCHDQWDAFASTFLRLTYSVAFAIVPLVLFIFIVGVLASNHIYD
ncbi:Tetraspanin family-domain-containing protein [Cladochytrium replicatum]|nr:Tetraspanin family-domain-containing protein [Cladochytrium replicatum]